MKKRILCYGDSNTWGAVPGEDETVRYPEEIGWPGVMQKLLGDGYQVIEEGYCGRTTVFDDPVENRLSGIAYFAPCIATHSPLDLIVIMLGTNDMKRKFAVGPKSCAFGLKRYLHALQSTPMVGAKPRILLAAPPVIEKDYKNNPLFFDMFGTDAYEQSLGFADEYEIFARENHLDYFNAAAYVKASSIDGIHLSPENHRILGEKLAEKIQLLV